MIKFLCPNGHQLSAPENLAGKAGKCPKCTTPFVVPALEEFEEPEPAPAAEPADTEAEEPAPQPAAAVAGSDGDKARETPAMGSGKQGAAAGELFVFLCPNGHKLNGPPSLKGRPGQCPHCGARFRIPSDDDLETPEEEVPTGEAEDEEIAEGQEVEEEGGFDFGRLAGGHEQPEDAVEAVVEDAPVAPPPPGASGLGYIVGRLWEQRQEGTELEIFLTEGEILAPDQFSEVLSSSDYGVFAVQEGDGSFVVTVIPWNAVRRIGVRRLVDLPPQLFQ